MAARNSNGKPGPDRAVLYLRMSSAKQDKSIDAQRDELTALAQRKGYTVVREYTDAAISGDNTERRTEFLRLRQDCENGPDFGTILVWDQDRLSRNDPLEIGYWLKPIRDAGVVVETPQGRVDWESFAGRMVYLIQQEGKHEFLRSLSRNVARGQLAAARNGKRHGTGGGGPRLYGYVTLPDGTVEVDPKRAEIVRRIFVEYAKPGSSLRSVANMLNADGIRSMRGTPWTGKAVQRVLTNRKYAGAYVRFRFRGGKYHAIQDGEIVCRNKTDKKVEAEPLVVVEGNHEPIVDQDLFDQAQRKLAQQQKLTFRRSGRQYVLSGLIRCGDCGKVMRGTPERHGDGGAYMCGTYHHAGKAACHANYVTEDRLLACVRRKLEERYYGETAIERMRRTIKQAQREAAEPVSPVDQRQLRKRIEALDQQIDRGAERVFTAPETIVPKLYAKLEELRQERDQLQRQLDAVGRTETRSAREQDQEVEAALDALRRLRETFDAAAPEDLRELISTLVVRVELEFSHRQAGTVTKNTCTGGKILVRPDSGLGSLLCPISRISTRNGNFPTSTSSHTA